MINLAVAVILAVGFGSAPIDDDPGHSEHGSAFDSGMRSKPWIFKGIGNAPFPITTAKPEAQKWFNQGNTLLQSFWFEEAERSFRWCLKLDPGCAMAYWGLARCGMTWFDRDEGKLSNPRFDRYKAFLREAVKREASVSERERMYIEVWNKGFADDVPNRANTLMTLLKAVSEKYPDDIEARALYGLFSIEQLGAPATQAIIDKVLAKDPMHPGAHHASIHNWDDVDPGKAIKSCELYGLSAPNLGHALHMPGHIYSKIGMWHEAAISMDSATRVELKYMNDRMALPYEDWDYAHNRNYLCDIQEQLGMLNASLAGSRDMLAAPRDVDVRGSNARAAREGFEALIRALVKFERWDDLLQPGYVPWSDSAGGYSSDRSAIETLALLGLGRPAEAKARLATAKNRDSEMFKVAQAKLKIADGHAEDGLKDLKGVATGDYFGGDPPEKPWPASRIVGDACLSLNDYRGAVTAYETALKKEPNDAFSLSGLARAYHGLGDEAKAERYADRLMYEWSGADPGLKWLTAVKALGLGKKQVAETLAPERRYNPSDLGHLGPSNWRPFAAPKLDTLDLNGRRVTLDKYRGRNVLLIFFLGSACIHCVQQLDAINRRIKEFDKVNTIVLAVCSQSPAQIKASSALADTQITLLSDRNHENSRRYESYDDFENLELHSTLLIDSAGRVRWKRSGGDPFRHRLPNQDDPAR